MRGLSLARLWSFWTRMGRDIRLTYLLMRDPRTPFYLKLIIVGALVYLIIPFDLFPDFFIPGVGYVDDLILLSWAIRFFLHRVPAALRREYGF